MHRISTGLNICTKSNCYRNSSVTMCKTSTDDTLHLISFDLQTIKCVKNDNWRLYRGKNNSCMQLKSCRRSTEKKTVSGNRRLEPQIVLFKFLLMNK